MKNSAKKTDRITAFYQGMKQLRKRAVPEELINRINENVEKDRVLEKKEPEKKRKIARPLKDEAGL